MSLTKIVINIVLIVFLLIIVGCTQYADEKINAIPDATVSRQNTLLPSNIPSEDKVDTKPILVAAGDEYSLALSDDGAIWAWGNNEYSILGDGTEDNRNFPIKVKGISDIVSIDGGFAHTIAIKKENRLRPVQITLLPKDE